MSDRFAYRAGARFYDFFSGERTYRVGRVAGVKLLGLQPGDTVLDVGCGTGLNFSLLRDAVGPTGDVIGLDRSAQMLQMARRRVVREGWTNVSLVEADATDFGRNDLPATSIDAVLATYALSLIPDGQAAWSSIRSVLRPGGRACIVDMQLPTGTWRVFSPLARLSCAMGGADINAHPWTMLIADAHDLKGESLRGGHIRVVAGTVG